jgi:hypothetical protein
MTTATQGADMTEQGAENVEPSKEAASQEPNVERHARTEGEMSVDDQIGESEDPS